VALYVIFDLHPVLLALAGTPMPTGVAHAAHLGGLAFGYIYWRQGLRLEDYWRRIAGFRWDRVFGSRRKIRLFSAQKEPPDDLDAKIDAVLQKILDRGEASLSDEDREVLRIVSQRHRKRTQS
jgi:hypothetical protein